MCLEDPGEDARWTKGIRLVTMVDVARHAGVSVMTVSNVVNERRYVSSQTRAKVLESITALGYSVNTTARNLRQGRTGVIGLAVPEIDRPYFGLLCALMTERAAQYGYALVIEQTGSRRESEMAAIRHARLRSYDGLFLHANRLTEDDTPLLRGDYPVVVLGEHTYSTPVDRIVMDDEAGGAIAASHLIERGCRSVAMVGGRVGEPGELDVATLRTKGFLAAVEENGPGFARPRLSATSYGLAQSRTALHELFAADSGIDGIFCATDTVAFGVLRGLADLGVRVPEDVKVVGFDNVTECAYSTPSLTSVAPDHDGMVSAGMRLLMERLSGERAAGDYREIVGHVGLAVRETTGV